MMEEASKEQNARKDFFISYSSDDRIWAEWIGWELEQAEYSTILPDWDFRPGIDRIQALEEATEEAERTMIVLSPGYIMELSTHPEWRSAFARTLKGKKGTLLPVIVRDCELERLLENIIYIDLSDLDESSARAALLSGVKSERAKPGKHPIFPGTRKTEQISPGSSQSPEGIKETEDAQEVPPRFPGSTPSWKVPARNPFFTGRAEIIDSLYEALRANQRPQALSGLGGIGKTQIATEYAYKYHDRYRKVLWMNAVSRKDLVANFTDQLHLPIKDSQAQDAVAHMGRKWLETNIHWLLVFDNVVDPMMVNEFLPKERRGHILITSRAQFLGELAECIEIEKMKPEEGARLLIKRAKIAPPKTSTLSLKLAKEIVRILDGLPLALDQVGAFIEGASCNLADCLEICAGKQLINLLRKRGGVVPEHPDPVAATWINDFERVGQISHAATELLHLCAFLYYERIPQEIITVGAPDLSPILQSVASNRYQLEVTIEVLRRFSLMGRDSQAKMLSINRLVQVVLRDGMDENTQYHWAERVVRAVNRTFPEIDLKTQKRCKRCLLHAHICVEHIGQWKFVFKEAAQLLHQLAHYLHFFTNNARSEELYVQALAIYQQVLEADEIDKIREKHRTWSQNVSEAAMMVRTKKGHTGRSKGANT